MDNFHTASETAKILGIDVSRVLVLCRSGRLGQSTQRQGKRWIITDEEIATYRELGPRPAGRPKEKE